MILGAEAIRAALVAGEIVCTPAPKDIENSHIDVTLGEHYWLFRPRGNIVLSRANPKDYFHPKARRPGSAIEIPPGGFVLAHTEEYIGTTPGSGLLPTLHTRSTLARWGVGIHPSAGWGDVAYNTRWTLEILNPHSFTVAIPVGARVGCIAFERVEGDAPAYEGRYNIQEWTPEAMLPRVGNW